MALPYRRLHLLALLALLAALAVPAAPARALTFTVSNTNDSGAGSLREAITGANSNPGPDTITFAVPDGTNFWTIRPLTPLPDLTDDGTTLEGPAPISGWPHPRVVIDGALLPAPTSFATRNNGLTILSSNNIVRRLALINFNGGTFETSGAGVAILAATGSSSRFTANGNRVEGCYIGVGVDPAGGTPGAYAAPNLYAGVMIRGASNNIIGSNGDGSGDAAERNVIAGNASGSTAKANVFVGSLGIFGISDVIATGNVVRGNYIGTNANGNQTIGGGNRNSGVQIEDLTSGTDLVGNVISGHTGGTTNQAGVSLIGGGSVSRGTGARIRGNIIGLGADGQATTLVPNFLGIRINLANDTTIGGASAADRNIITGNGRQGGSNSTTIDPAAIYIDMTERLPVTVEGNVIGLDIDGDALPVNSSNLPTGNLGSGINTFIGASTNPAASLTIRSNVISGNNRNGIRLNTTGGSSGHVITSNLIGTDAGGSGSSAALTNGSAGIRVERSSNTTVSANIVAVGATQPAISVKPSGTGSTPFTATVVQNNRVGINAADAALRTSRAGTGILVDRADGSTNQANTSGNTISGNRIGGVQDGIAITNNATGNNTVRANRIGLGATFSERGVGRYGIYLAVTSGNTIGGAAPTDGNQITDAGSHGILVAVGASNNTVANNDSRDNTGDGVRVDGATGVVIDRTTTRNNAGSGIGLSANGNNTMPPPTFPGGNGAFSFSPQPQVTVSVDATRCASGCTVQIFTSPTNDAAEAGEGPRFLAENTSVTSSATIPVPACDRFLTATARQNSTGDTSPFQTAVVDTVTGCGAANIELSQGVRIAPGFTGSGPVPPGSTVIYEYTVTNVSGVPADVTVAIDRTGGQNWSSDPSRTTFQVAVGTPQKFTVTVNVPANAPGGTRDQFSLTVTGGAQPRSVTTETIVAQSFGVDIEPPRSATYTTAPTSVTFEHTITNTGNGQDTITLSAVANPAAGVTFGFEPSASCPNLAAGASCTRIVRVNIPAGAVPSYTITVTATSSGGATDQVVDTAVSNAAAPLIAPRGSIRDAFPGDTVTFNHTVQNVGTQAGTFTPAAAVVSPTPPPAGWQTTINPSAPFPLAQGATTTLDLTSVVPGYPTAPISGTIVRTQLSVTSQDGLSDSVEDAVRVRLLPRFSLGAASPATVNAPPGGTVTFVHRLTNESNGDDSYVLTISPSADLENLSVSPGTTLFVPRGQFVDITIQARVRDFTTPGPQTIQISAQTVSTPQVTPAPTQTDTITVDAVAGVRISPAQRQAVGSVPALVNFTHVITNVGNVAGTFTVTPAFESPSPGWSLGTVVQDPAGCLTNLPSRGTCRVTVAVNVPADPLPENRAYPVRITVATGAASASVVDNVDIGPIARLAFAPDRSGATGPDTPVEYTHTLTNTGNITATFTLNVASLPSGWPAPQITPSVVTNLPPGQARAISVRITPPPNLAAGGSYPVVVSAQSSVAPNPTASVTDTTTILAADGARFTPPALVRAIFPTPGRSATARYDLTLANSGNTTISYTLRLDPATLGGWTGIVTPTRTLVLPPNITQTVPVSVTITAPAGSSGVRAARLEARNGLTNGPVLATAILTATANSQLSELLTPPVNRRSTLPGTTLVYTHTLKNILGESDTFRITYIAPFGWETTVEPSTVTLAAGATQAVNVAIRVPSNVLSGTLDITTLTVTSLTDPSVTASAEERTTVTQSVGSSLSPRFVRRAVQGEVIELRQTLVNAGNAPDSFTLSATSTLGWPVTITPASTSLTAFGLDPFITVRVTVPASASSGATDRVIVRATSRSDPRSVSEIDHLIVLPPPEPTVVEQLVYLPLIGRP